VTQGADLRKIEYGDVMQRIGVISDTHGLLRPEAVAALSGVDHILHAGDIGSSDIIATLGEIAPVTAVRGNNDKGPWAATIPESQLIEIEGRRIYLLHNIALLEVDPVTAGIRVVVSGHSHKAVISDRKGVLFLNPGSAGPRRFKLPVTLATLRMSARFVAAKIHELQIK
jgi:putative phosphoesterase